jgi:ParB-like chromosome segregation protein Spo0J
MQTHSTLSHVLDCVNLDLRIMRSCLECIISPLPWQVPEAEMVMVDCNAPSKKQARQGRHLFDGNNNERPTDTKEDQMSLDLMKHTPQASHRGALHDDKLFDATTSRDCIEREISAQDEALLTLMKRLGIESPLSYETRHLPIDRLIVPGEKLMKSSAGQFQTNIQLVGLLHAPLVVLEQGQGIDDPEATFRVVAGRRRVAGACRAGLTYIECRVYDALSPQMRALIVLSENMHRSPAWVEELKALVELVDEKVGMTDTELAKSLGVPITRVREQLKLARLPPLLLSQIFAGKMNLGTAKQLVRLSKTQQAFLVSLAEMGEEITAELVEQILRRQISTGLAPLQEMLAQQWEEPVTEFAHTNGNQAMSLREAACSNQAIQEREQVQDGTSPEVEISLSHLLSTLLAFEQQLPQSQETARARLLTKALCQELEMLQRQQAKNVTA